MQQDKTNIVHLKVQVYSAEKAYIQIRLEMYDSTKEDKVNHRK